MRLSDTDILKAIQSGEIIIDNFDPQRLQPASYDVLLGYSFLTFEKHEFAVIDPREDNSKYMRKHTLKSKDDFFILHPKEFCLAVTHDHVGVGAGHSMELMGKSSLARLGLIIHTTGGFIDPGNTLNITLELLNANSAPIKLYPEMKIGQVAFTQLTSPVNKPYGHADLNSKYHGATDVQASAMHKNYKSS
jgi:dCTP deaminase